MKARIAAQFGTCLLVLLFLSIPPAHAAAWPHDSQQAWTEEWERKYSKWIEQSVGPDWFQKKGFIFSGWEVDCAKAVYLLRLYFSYINGLEFAITNQQSPTKKISSLQPTWDHLPSYDQRTREFARFILGRVSTSTLPSDTVLIAINRQEIRPGVILAADKARAHTWFIKKVSPAGFPKFLYGTLPKSDILYESFAFPVSHSTFPLKRLPSDQSGGLRRFKWPQHIGKPLNQISYRSEDQSGGSMSYSSFFEQVQERIAVVPKTADQEIESLMEDLCAKLWARVDVIIDSHKALTKRKGSRFSVEEENIYSTPKRDQDIVDGFQHLDFLFQKNQHRLSTEMRQRYDTVINPRWYSDDECLVTWAKNRTEPLGALRTRFLNGHVSSDPYSSFPLRWGILQSR